MALKPPASCPDCALILDACWRSPKGDTVCEQAVIDNGSLVNNSSGFTMSFNELMPLMIAILLLMATAKVFNILFKFLWRTL